MCASAKHRRWQGRKILNPGPTQLAKGGLFPCHDESLRELCNRVCEESLDRVRGGARAARGRSEGDEGESHSRQSPVFEQTLA